MKKLLIILLIIASLWTHIVITDLTATVIVGRPLLCVSMYGGEVISYLGLGYTIDVFYPLTSGDEIIQYCPYSFWLWPYVIGMLILLILIASGIFKSRHDKKRAKGQQ